MTLHMQIQAEPFGDYTDLDLAALRLSRLLVRFSYQHPAIASWTLTQPQHSLALPLRQFIRLWDDVGTTPDDEPQTAENPLFEGYIEEAQPGADGLEVHYVAYDPTRKSTAEQVIMSGPWSAGEVGVVPPAPGFGTYPRLVFNVRIDNDDDYAYERDHDLSLGEIIGVLLDDLYHPLLWANAASGGVAYDTDDLERLTFRPQEKLVFESESLRSGIERVLQWDPANRLLFYPGVRLWRFEDITQSPETTLTLNDAGATHVVLSLRLQRSLEGRYSAVKIYGPQTLTQVEALWSDDDLTLIPSDVLLQNNLATCCDVPGLNSWQITNADLRRVARLLPGPIYVQYADYYYATTRSPTFLAYWPENTAAGNSGWRAVHGWQLDAKSGTISFRDNYVYRFNPTPAPGEPHHEIPSDVKFVYAYPNSPLSIRYPASGFEGSAYTEAGLENELRLYDEALAVGYEYNQPVTTGTRLGEFLKLAQRLHTFRKDIIHTGGCTLDGIDYTFCRLGRRINLAGQDADGEPLPTGWEEIRAVLTDVEYDFDQGLTTLQFSSDQMELLGLSPEQLKAQLKLRALELRVLVSASVNTRIRNRNFSDAFGFHATGDTLETTYTLTTRKAWVDQETGEEET